MSSSSHGDEARRALAAEIGKLCHIVAEDMRRQAIAACEAEIQQIIDMGANAGTCAGYGRITAGNIIHRIKRLPTQPAAEGGAE